MTRITAVLSSFVILACSAATSTPITDVVGTWGGDNAGLIVNGTDVHVHIGCTLGDAVGPVLPDANGRFGVSGTSDERVSLCYGARQFLPCRSGGEAGSNQQIERDTWVACFDLGDSRLAGAETHS